MDANLKLLKKKRVAHIGSKLPNVNCVEPKLPPDDFVFDIMKDMDKKKNVISYQQSQELKSQNRQDASPNEDTFSCHKSFHSKQAKKILPKKTFPLMKKCQTSLKHLKKNRCIPKPRAHVGSIPKPQCKPILNVEKSPTKYQHGSVSRISKTKHSNGKYSSCSSQPDFKVTCKTSKFKSHVRKEVDYVKEKAQVEDQLSSSDDDAFEHFIQKQTEQDSDSSDSDTDSRLIIHRKRSKSKSTQKKKFKNLLFDNKVNKHVSKITSRPLSDSTESEGQDTFEEVKNKNNSIKRRKTSEHESPMRFLENIKENVPEEIHDTNLSEHPQDLSDFNYDSSDSESNLEGPTACVLSIDQSQSFDHTKSKSCENIKVNNVTHSTTNVDVSNFNSNSSNLVLCYSEPTKSVPKCDELCYVRIIRDPVLDKRAMGFYLTTPALPTSSMFNSSDDDDDCIVLSENSDNKEISEVSKSLDSSFSATCPCEDTEPDDCVIMCEMPKQGLDTQSGESNTTLDSLNSKPVLSNTSETNAEIQIHYPDGINNLSSLKLHSNQIGPITSVKDSFNQQSSHIKTYMNECVVECEESKPDALEKIPELSDPSILEKTANPDLSSQATNELTSIEHNEDNTINSEIQDFNVQIVAVHSLTELDEPLFENSASECNDVEIIDISDDMPDVREKSNVVKEVNILENHEHNLIKCEPNSKILEILSKIDFECIKEVISKTKLEHSKNESCQIEESSTCSDLLLGTSIPAPTCGKDIINKEKNSANCIGFQTQNSKFDKNKIDQLYDTSELISEETGSQVGNVNAILDKLSNNQLVESAKNITAKYDIKSPSKQNCVKDLHTRNLSLGKNTNKDWLEVGTSLVNNENTNSLINNVCAKEILSEVSSRNLIKETQSKVNSENPSSLESRTVGNVNCELPIHFEQNSQSVFNQFSNTADICRAMVCNGSEATESLTKRSAKNDQQDSNTIFRTTSQITISDKGKVNVSKPADNTCKIYNVKNEKNIQNPHIMQPIKKEVDIESPADELDVIAASYIDDLKSSDKKVLTLLEVYKAEYEKYKQIKNTEMNVSAGLKLLHDNQVKKLKHLHISINNLTKHDACFYKVNQEDCCNSVKTLTQNETVDIKREQNPKELEREGPFPEVGDQVATKFDSAGTSREKLFRFMMNIKCAQCGKQATARCQGCAEVYYCSPHCGEQSWRQGHYAVCKKS